MRFQNKHECGGAYIKLLADTPSLSLENFGDKTEYSIMFGPDKCGGDSKVIIFSLKLFDFGSIDALHRTILAFNNFS